MHIIWKSIKWWGKFSWKLPALLFLASNLAHSLANSFCRDTLYKLATCSNIVKHTHTPPDWQSNFVLTKYNFVLSRWDFPSPSERFCGKDKSLLSLSLPKALYLLGYWYHLICQKYPSPDHHHHCHRLIFENHLIDIKYMGNTLLKIFAKTL